MVVAGVSGGEPRWQAGKHNRTRGGGKKQPPARTLPSPHGNLERVRDNMGGEQSSGKPGVRGQKKIYEKGPVLGEPEQQTTQSAQSITLTERHGTQTEKFAYGLWLMFL